MTFERFGSNTEALSFFVFAIDLILHIKYGTIKLL